MARPSENLPTNSTSEKRRYRPPRRESIEDHLTVARSRWRPEWGKWTDKTATVDWVLDLNKKELLNGPEDADKSDGAGRGKRYKPRDYRDLLEVIRLKIRGCKRRSTWTAHLWLRGHYYPIQTFREALLYEVRKYRKETLDDFAPRGWTPTTDFQAQYERYMAKRKAMGKADESPLFAYLAAWQIAPNRINEITPDVAGVAAELNEMVDTEVPGLGPALANMFDAAFKGEAFTEESARALYALVQQTPLAGLIDAVANSPELQKDLADLPKRLRGTVDDGRAGDDTSSLINTVNRASEEHFKRARRWHVGLRAGKLERILRDALVEAPTDAVAMIEPMLRLATFQREIMHMNPVLAIHIFVNLLQSDVPVELLDTEPTKPARYRAVMRYFYGAD